MTAAAQPPPVYADRQTGQVFADARSMVNAYLARFSERAGTALEPLDESGYTQVRKGSASVGVNVLDDHGVLLFLAPVMAVPLTGKETFYRRLLEQSFLATSDAAFAIDAQKDEIFVRALRRLSGLDYEEFEDLLDTVGKVADEWDDALRREFASPKSTRLLTEPSASQTFVDALAHNSKKCAPTFRGVARVVEFEAQASGCYDCWGAGLFPGPRTRDDQLRPGKSGPSPIRWGSVWSPAVSRPTDARFDHGGFVRRPSWELD